MGLLLILALATLAFARDRKATRRTPAKEQDYKRGSIYYWPLDDWNKDFEIEYKYVASSETDTTEEETELDSVKIEDFKTVVDGTVDDEKVYSVAKDKAAFDELATSKPVTASCGVVEDEYRSYDYGLFGYTIKAIKDKDIAPSITKLVADGPAKILWTGVPEAEKEYYENETIVKTCANKEVYIFLDTIINKNGIHDAACYPNDKVPAADAACVAGKKDAYLKGYRYGEFYKADAATIKSLILRFGAVSTDLGIIIGWDKVVPTGSAADATAVASWIVAVPYGTGPTVTPYVGHFEFNAIAIGTSDLEGNVLFSGFSVIRTFLSLVLAAVLLPAFFL